MTQYINVLTKEYPAKNFIASEIIIPARIKFYAAKGKYNKRIYAAVTEVSPPLVDYSKNVIEGAPVETDGVWTQVWDIIDALPSEIAARTSLESTKARSVRDALLISSDWTQIPDVPQTVSKTAWATYRQELRDISLQSGFPWAVIWPTVPS